MEMVTAARKQLLLKPSVTTLVGQRIWKWGEEGSLEGTGHAAIVLRNGGQWSKPGKNSQEYPILTVECCADMSRDADGEPSKDDAEDRAMAVFREVDRHLHQVSRYHRFWPETAVNHSEGLYVAGCFRGSEPTAPTTKYGVKVIRVTYDLNVFH